MALLNSNSTFNAIFNPFNPVSLYNLDKFSKKNPQSAEVTTTPTPSVQTDFRVETSTAFTEQSTSTSNNNLNLPKNDSLVWFIVIPLMFLGLLNLYKILKK